ncbi:IclR family transcriptional regulator [Agrococcus jejuensis]|uniref:DNA-binding transcriptional regulator, IclR family n=1 Tax=Agrococcus jejuensis TaxID=399736 RepID=A0A1G8FMK1_9MICO|nr:IclR family transcriptional regulator [Agrococcus jejuensis]SDH83342.1 DNA-binding transcriptional regulator, IclR family [Agrococcus jejuensis]
MAGDGADQRDPAPAVTRGLGILGLLAASDGPMTLTELSKALGIAKSSASNLCLALEAGGVVERVPLGFRLGRGIAELGAAYTFQFNQVRELFSVCERSTVLRREVVQIAMLADSDALYLARHEGRAHGRIGTPLGSRLHAGLSATGNALLMALDDDEVRALMLAAPAPRLTARSAGDVDAVVAKVRRARERGYAVDEGQSFEGITGVAVPLPAWTPSDPALAIGVALPADVATPEHVAAVGLALQQAATALTNPLGRPAR